MHTIGIELRWWNSNPTFAAIRSRTITLHITLFYRNNDNKLTKERLINIKHYIKCISRLGSQDFLAWPRVNSKYMTLINNCGVFARTSYGHFCFNSSLNAVDTSVDAIIGEWEDGRRNDFLLHHNHPGHTTTTERVRIPPRFLGQTVTACGHGQQADEDSSGCSEMLGHTI